MKHFRNLDLTLCTPEWTWAPVPFHQNKLCISVRSKVSEYLQYFQVSRSDVTFARNELIPSILSTKNELFVSIPSKVDGYSHHYRFLGQTHPPPKMNFLYRSYQKSVSTSTIPGFSLRPYVSQIGHVPHYGSSKKNFLSRSVQNSVVTRTICCFSVRLHVRHILHEPRYPSTKYEVRNSFRSKVGDYSHYLVYLGPIR